MNLSGLGDGAARGVARALVLLAAAVLVFITPGRNDAMEAVGGRAEQGPAARQRD